MIDILSVFPNITTVCFTHSLSQHSLTNREKKNQKQESEETEKECSCNYLESDTSILEQASGEKH